MIRLFKRNETDFTHNETVLNDVISSVVEEEANGLYEVVLEYPRNDFAKTLTEGKILKVPTPRGEQLFRIYKPAKDLTRYKIYARHIFYDLLTNFIEAIKPTNKSGSGAINDILSAAQIDQGFTATSDIINMGTAYYVRMNPVQALLGAPNSFLNVWGGELVRNNHTFSMKARGGQDRGYEVRIGKNLIGVEVDTDESDVYTRIYPTVVIDGNTVTTLPEKYVDSPLINSYEYPRIIEERIDLLDEEKELPLADIYKLMRKHCADLFKSGIDKPEVNFKIDFVELSKTEQYKHIQILEQLDLYDTVSIYVPELDVNIQAKVIRYEYDSLGEKYLKMELGSFKANGGSQAKNTINRIDKNINQAVSSLQQAFDKAQDMITGNLGGHVIFRVNTEGKPYEILVMDTEDIQTAKNVIRLNQQGLGFSQSGYNGPFGIAMTIDGHVVADFIDVGTLTGLRFVNNFFRGTVPGKLVIDGDIRMNAEDDSRFALNEKQISFSDGVYETALQKDGLDFYRDGVRTLGQRFFTFEDGTTGIRFESHHIGERALSIRGNQLLSHDGQGGREDESHLYLSPGGSGRVVAGDAPGKRVTMRARTFMMGDRVRITNYDNGDGILRLYSRGFIWNWGTGDTTDNPMFRMDADAFRMYKNLDMTGRQVLNTSDRRMKRDVTPTKIKGRETIRSYDFIDYYYTEKDYPKEKQFGLIAQDTAFIGAKGEDGNWTISTTKQVMLNSLVAKELDEELMEVSKVVKEQKEELIAVKQELADLKALLTDKGVI